MKITFLGTSHGITEKDRFTSSILLTAANKNYVIDAGAPIMKLLRERDVDFSSVGGIFITHSHADHYMGLVEFMCQIENFREFEGVKINVYAPRLFPFYAMREFIFGKEGVNDITKSTTKIGGSRNKAADTEGFRINCSFYEDGSIFDDGNVKISAIPTQHMPDSHAFLIEAEGKKILISGDLRHDFSDFPKVAMEEELDAVITEAAHPLLNTDAIINVISSLKAKKLFITHICPFRNTQDMIDELKENVAHLFPTIAVCDGDVFEI